MTTSITVEHIANQVMALPPSERARLVDWFFDLELGHDSWDEQIARDSQPGGGSKESCQKCVATLKQNRLKPSHRRIDDVGNSIYPSSY